MKTPTKLLRTSWGVPVYRHHTQSQVLGQAQTLPAHASTTLESYSKGGMTKKDVLPPFALDLYMHLETRTWITRLNLARTAELKVVMNLLLPLYPFRQEINLVFLASELFTIYFSINAQAFSLSSPLGETWSGWHHLISSPSSCFNNIIPFSLSTSSYLGSWRIGVHQSWHWLRGGVHPRQVASPWKGQNTRKSGQFSMYAIEMCKETNADWINPDRDWYTELSTLLLKNSES